MCKYANCGFKNGLNDGRNAVIYFVPGLVVFVILWGKNFGYEKGDG